MENGMEMEWRSSVLDRVSTATKCRIATRFAPDGSGHSEDHAMTGIEPVAKGVISLVAVGSMRSLARACVR